MHDFFLFSLARSPPRKQLAGNIVASLQLDETSLFSGVFLTEKLKFDFYQASRMLGFLASSL